MGTRWTHRSLVLAAVLVASLVAPAPQANAGERLVRVSCISVGSETRFEGCASLVKRGDKLVAKGFADNASESGAPQLLVRVTRIRLQTHPCTSDWWTVRANPSRKGWFDREYDNTKGQEEVSIDGRQWRARVTVSWKLGNTNRETRVITTRTYGTC